MKKKICTFAGHADIFDEQSIKQKLKDEIINLIENENVDTFYCGDKGDFDRFCAECVNKLKTQYSFIESYMILSYLPGKKNEFDSNPYKDFDGTIYPYGLEFVPKRFAIVKRNEWVIDNSSFLITYINHKWGGAYRTLEYAKRKKHIQFINIAN